MAEVRAAIGDRARHPEYIRTAHSFGYAFCGAVRELDTPALAASDGAIGCRLIWGAREIELVSGESLFGAAQAAPHGSTSPVSHAGTRA
jgi:hypothetical protein